MNAPAFIVPPAPAQTIAIGVDNVRKSFGDRIVLKDIEIDIPQGEIVAIVGESGCGKSTLLRIFAGLDRADGGAINVKGQVSVAFQDARLLPWQRVWENVSFGLPDGRDARREKAFAALDEVGLSSLGEAWPGTLSGGEAQRVALARALIRNPAVLLLDEPFGALDALTRLRMHKLLQNLWQSHRFTVVLVTHDVDEALSLADRVVVLGAGRILDQFKVGLPQPRNRANRELGGMRNRLLSELGVPAD